jgi:hypothetical protein
LEPAGAIRHRRRHGRRLTRCKRHSPICNRVNKALFLKIDGHQGRGCLARLNDEMKRREILPLLLCAGMALLVVPAFARVGVVVNVPPPAPIVETPAPPPAPGYAWQPGYWAWNGVQYAWVPGQYVVAPAPGAVWVAGHWQPRGGGWVWLDGHWRHRRR